MKNQRITTTTGLSAHDTRRTLANTTLAALLIAPTLAMAADGISGDVTGAVGTACNFLGNVNTLLNAVSIVVVTIAVIFSGYQIAFAHKRVADVAPIMIGGILIGAAGQIANMFLSTSAGDSQCSASLVPDSLNPLAAAAQWLLQYA
jgi:type IV secretion system protein VirB2